MENTRAQLLALLTQAAADPSVARRLYEQALLLIDRELKVEKLPPGGYVYHGAHTLVARFDEVLVEPLPDPDNPQIPPLTDTVNRPSQLEIPFDCLIEGVSGWAAPRLEPRWSVEELNGVLEMGACQDGRDLFGVYWNTDGKVDYSTDGRTALLEPAPVILGTRRRPRALGWQAKRDTKLNVYVRNLTNLLNPSAFESEETAGWPITVQVEFHLVNMETP